MTSVPIASVAEPYIRLRAIHHLQKGYAAIFVAKQGVNGVYTSDPKENKDAKKYRTLNYNDVVKEDIQVMDQAALLLARDHDLPVHVFDFEQSRTMERICKGENPGTLIGNLDSSFS